MKIMVLNSGSSSIKFRLFEMPERAVLAWGLVERIGDEHARVHLSLPHHRFPEECMIEQLVGDHREGMELLLQMLGQSGVIESSACIEAVGHRVVHGGESFRAPARIDDAVFEAIRSLIPLAPLHNPANLEGIEIARQQMPEAEQIAVFDTAFHQSLPESAYLYALPYELYEQDGVRRYGFHGTSHAFVAKAAASLMGRELASLNLITLHLGNGASAAAIRGGTSVETSMGMTPLEGLVMGTRSGDLDPAIALHLSRVKGWSPGELDALLNKRSGLLGLCGENDMRRIEARQCDGDASASRALGVFAHRLKKYIGAYAAVLGRVDAVVFTGGIGEHSARVRALVCEGLETVLGISIDAQRNERASGSACRIEAESARVAVLVVPTNEELEIALETEALLDAERE